MPGKKQLQQRCVSDHDGAADTGEAEEFMKNAVRDKRQFGRSVDSASNVTPRHSRTR